VNAFFSGSQPRAVTQVDGRALSANEYLYGVQGLWDVNRVEIFRGPQTTTQGRHSIAGAIFVQINDPTFYREAALRAEVGDYGTTQFSGLASGPILDEELAYRFTFDTRDHETWVNRPANAGGVGRDQDRDGYDAFRGKLLWTPKAALALTSKLTFTHTFTSGPQTEVVDRGDATSGPKTFADRFNSNLGAAVWTTRADALTHELGLKLGEYWQLTQRSTLADTALERCAPLGKGTATLDGKEYVSETLARYAPAAGGRLTGLLGLYAGRFEQEEILDISAFLALGGFEDRRRSLGVFGEATYQLTERLNATAGLRYQHDEQKRVGALGPLAVDYDESFGEWLPKFDLAYQLTARDRVGATIARGMNPGGVSVSFFTGAATEFAEETLWNYELYWRGDRLDGKLRAEANIFFSDLRDTQRFADIATGLPPPNDLDQRVENAARARSWGAELSASYTPDRAVTLQGGLGLLQTELVEFASAAGSLAGRDFQRAPELTAFLGATWRPVAGLSLAAQTRYVGDYFSDDANIRSLAVDAHTITDVQVAYSWRRYRVYVYCTNVFDTFQETQLFDNDLDGVADQAALNDPREVGLGLEWKF
jgi:iron complex outermembrane recepter protein